MSSHARRKTSSTSHTPAGHRSETMGMESGGVELNPLDALDLGMGLEAARAALTLPTAAADGVLDGLGYAKEKLTNWWAKDAKEEEKHALDETVEGTETAGFAPEWLSDWWGSDSQEVEQVAEVAEVATTESATATTTQNDIAGIVLFPDFPIGIGDQPAHKFLKGVGVPLPSTLSNLGHAGLLAINTDSGLTRYAEYGRYSKPAGATPGVARRKTISNMDGYNKDSKERHKGLPTPAMLQPVLAEISRASGHLGRVELYLVENVNFAAIDSFISSSLTANADPNKPAYDILDNSCMSYALNGIAAGGDSTPRDYTVDPRPAGHNPWESWYERAEYDPTLGTQYTTQGPKK